MRSSFARCGSEAMGGVAGGELCPAQSYWRRCAKNMKPKSPEMPAAVLDAWALLAWLGDEPGAGVVERWLGRAARNQDPLALSVINAGEVHYRLIKAGHA